MTIAGRPSARSSKVSRSIAEEVTLAAPFASAIAWHGTIMEADLAQSFAAEYERGVSDRLGAMIARGQSTTAAEYAAALEKAAGLKADLKGIFADYDAVLTPATLGTAPIGLESTGSPAFCTLWTLTGVPAVTVPLLKGGDGMPLGVQLVGAEGDDAGTPAYRPLAH